MGVWGDGVFDGDGQCDFLGDVIDRLQEVVEEGLELGRSKRRTRYRRANLVKGTSIGLHEPVVPAVAVLHAIFAEIPAARVCLSKKRVRRWKRAYFEWYERVYVPVNGPCTRYRKNIEKEFDGVARLAVGEELEDEGEGDQADRRTNG
ncbi:MAG TPA: hypothetical protein VKE74_14510 [Gemmataceae bacterium]|nr:hypothetical protein [Gemmataceae bacterium]